MPRIKNDDYLRMSEAAKIVSELTGVTRCMSTVHKWVRDGRLDQHGRLVKLRMTRKLGRNYTTREWLKKFIKEIG